jgi:SAM-dependent methyltransferase
MLRTVAGVGTTAVGKRTVCIFCGEVEALPVIHENGHDAYRCPNCGLIFVSPLPPADEVADLYREDNAHLSAESHISGFGRRIGRLYARHALRLIRRHAREGAFLEIGAGNGNVLAEARAAGFAAHGVELNPTQAAFIRDRLQILCATSLDDLRDRLPGRTFDIVYHCDVLSHFFDPVAEFRELNGLLAPGGLHVFETGNLGDVDERYFDLFHRFQLPDHLFFFSDRNLDELLARSGFERVATYRYSLVPQLRLTSWLRRARARVRPPTETSNGDGADAAEASAGGHSAFWTAFEYLLFGLRYGLGAIWPKTGRPQTVVVVARKREAVTDGAAAAQRPPPAPGRAP